MGIVQIIQIIVWVISNLPALIKAVKYILDLIKKLPKREQKAAGQELSRALKHYKLTEDGEKLPKAHRRKPTFERLERLREALEARLR